MPHHPVRPRLTLFIVLILAIAGCGGDAQPSPSPPPGGSLQALEGTSWLVVSVDAMTPVAGTRPAVAFGGGGKVQGSGGCNSFGGSYRFDPATGQIAIAELGMTAMGCVQAGVGDFEGTFLRVLGATTEAALDATGRLVLGHPGGTIILATDRPVQ